MVCMKPYTDGHADKPQVGAAEESQEGCEPVHVSEAHGESSQITTATEHGSIVRLHCVTWE